ncbi:MAG: dTDP-4-amino-4,6-dideoxygalactose transaminase [Planctomycetia bacterium]|nr:dTDP-4-amino-4,6-dideoxygalactose transaminase [Planctomycetia bacterium]
MAEVPFNFPYYTGREIPRIQEAMTDGRLQGDGPMTKRCRKLLEERYRVPMALLTHSCTGALEMAALLLDIQPGDEFIVPSYTFVSTANAFVLRGGVPIWCDIRADTMNMDENQIESLITPRTKAIVPVHYAGVSCEMDQIMRIAEKHRLWVVEDAAQGVEAFYRNRALGTIGHLGCYSFHNTKNYGCGEGGALLVNDERFMDRALILREKGTNRSQFLLGQVDKYTWVDLGGSFLMSDLSAAFLLAQLESVEQINQKRLALWRQYRDLLTPCEKSGYLRLPVIPEECTHNAHMFYIQLSTSEERRNLLKFLNDVGIGATFHYIPLHTSPMGRKVQPSGRSLPVTEEYASRLLRLPMYAGLTESQVTWTVDQICTYFHTRKVG